MLWRNPARALYVKLFSDKFTKAIRLKLLDIWVYSGYAPIIRKTGPVKIPRI